MFVRDLIITSTIALASGAGFEACSSTQTKVDGAGAAYAAQQADCVVQASTREEADACRARVKAAWTVDAGEGGAK